MLITGLSHMLSGCVWAWLLFTARLSVLNRTWQTDVTLLLVCATLRATQALSCHVRVTSIDRYTLLKQQNYSRPLHGWFSPKDYQQSCCLLSKFFLDTDLLGTQAFSAFWVGGDKGTFLHMRTNSLSEALSLQYCFPSIALHYLHLKRTLSSNFLYDWKRPKPNNSTGS